MPRPAGASAYIAAVIALVAVGLLPVALTLGRLPSVLGFVLGLGVFAAAVVMRPQTGQWDLVVSKLGAGASNTTAAPLLFWASCAAALGLTLGEGAAYLGVGLVVGALIVSYRQELMKVYGRLGRSPAAAALSVYLGCAAAAWALGGYGILKVSELGRLVAWLSIPVAATAIALLDSRQRRSVGLVFFGGLAASALFGVAQYLFNLETTQGLSGALGHLSANKQLLAPGSTTHSAAAGFYMHRLKLGDALTLGAGLLCVRQLFVPMEWGQRLKEGAVAALLAAGLVLTFARGAYLSLAVGILACVVVAPIQIRKWALALGVVLGLGAMAFSPVRDRVLGSFDAPVGDRSVIWTTAYALIEQSPAGVGLGNLPKLLEARYANVGPKERFPRTYAHNLTLSAWVESGPLGAVAFVAAWAALLLFAVGLLRAQPLAGASLLFIVVAYWMGGTMHDVLYHRGMGLLFGSAVGAVLGLTIDPARRPETQ